MAHDDNHAIYLASTFDVKAKPVHTKAKPLRLEISSLALDRTG